MKKAIEIWLGTSSSVLMSSPEQCRSGRPGAYFQKQIFRWAKYCRQMTTVTVYNSYCVLRGDVYLNSLRRLIRAWSVTAVLRERMCWQQLRVAEFYLCFRHKSKCLRAWSKSVSQRNYLNQKNQQATFALQKRQKAVLFRSFKCLLPRIPKAIGVLRKDLHRLHYSFHLKSIRFVLNGWKDMMEKKKWAFHLYIFFQQRRLMSLVIRTFHFLCDNPNTIFKVYRSSYICSQAALTTKCTSKNTFKRWNSCLITDDSSCIHADGKLVVRYTWRRASIFWKDLRKFYFQLKSQGMKDYLLHECKCWRLSRYCKLITTWRKNRAISGLFCVWRSIRLNAVITAQQSNAAGPIESMTPSQKVPGALLRSAFTLWATVCFRKLHAQMLFVKISSRLMQILIRQSFTEWILAVKMTNLQGGIICFRILGIILRRWVRYFLQIEERKLIRSELIERTRLYVLRHHIHAWNIVGLCQPNVRLICHRDLLRANAHFSRKCKARHARKWSGYVSQRDRLSLIEMHSVRMQQENHLVHMFCVWSENGKNNNFRQQVMGLTGPGKYNTLVHRDDHIKTQFCSRGCDCSTVTNSRFYSIKLGFLRLRFHTWRVTTFLIHKISINQISVWVSILKNFFESNFRNKGQGSIEIAKYRINASDFLHME